MLTSTILKIIAALVVVIAWLYNLYSSLIRKRNKVQEAFSSIDVQLKKRYDLIPNILILAKKYMDNERGLIEEVTKLRTDVMNLSKSPKNIDRKIALDTQIAQKMRQIIVAVENYPQLKTAEPMVIAMQTYNEVEEHIAAARRFYNIAANELKNAVEIFPSSLFARLLNIKTVDFFKATEQEKQTVNAAEFFN